MKGYPEPSLQWFFEGNAISNESDNYMISGSGDLTILKVTADMEGEFQCKATNQYGSRTASARLKVVSTTTIGKFTNLDVKSIRKWRIQSKNSSKDYIYFKNLDAFSRQLQQPSQISKNKLQKK